MSDSNTPTPVPPENIDPSAGRDEPIVITKNSPLAFLGGLATMGVICIAMVSIWSCAGNRLGSTDAGAENTATEQKSAESESSPAPNKDNEKTSNNEDLGTSDLAEDDTTSSDDDEEEPELSLSALACGDNVPGVTPIHERPNTFWWGSGHRFSDVVCKDGVMKMLVFNKDPKKREEVVEEKYFYDDCLLPPEEGGDIRYGGRVIAFPGDERCPPHEFMDYDTQTYAKAEKRSKPEGDSHAVADSDNTVAPPKSDDAAVIASEQQRWSKVAELEKRVADLEKNN